MRSIVPATAILLFLLATPRVNSQTLDLSFTHSEQVVRVVFPSELSSVSPQLLEWTRNSLAKAEARLGLKLRDNVEVYFDPRPLNHNGLTTVVPRNRIFVHVEAPDLSSSIGLSRFYMMETLVHEWGHMLSIQEHSGVFGPLSWVLGHTSRPNGSWPRWIHEGIAVWTEESVGGRPLSGSVDFDLRRYAEYSKRTGQAALSNSMLDGNWELKSFRPGQVPYTFGYLFFEHLHRTKNFSLGKFSEISSKSLGVSFRKTFQEAGIDITAEFADLQKKWAATPLQHLTSPAKTLSTATAIVGLQSYEERSSWIEIVDDENPWFASTEAEEIRRYRWPFDLLSPQQSFSLAKSKDSETWAVLVDTLPAWLSSSFHSPSAPFRRRLVIWDSAKTELRCVFDLGERLREVELQPGRLAWVTSLAHGQHQLHQAEWSENCELRNVRVQTESQAFGRIAAPRFAGEKLYYTENFPSSDAYDERIRDDAGRELRGARGTADVITQFAPHESGQALVFEKSRDYWGPQILQARGPGYLGQRLPLRTGATEARLSPDGRTIYYIEKLWDRDELMQIPVDAKSLVPGLSLEWQDSETKNSNELTNVAEPTAVAEPHTPLDDLWPHFWIPSLLASQGSWIIAGQTFYSDLSKTWNGATFLGYNTGTRRPFVASSLSWTSQRDRLRPQVDFSAEYNPRYVSFFGLADQKVQERAAGDLAIALPYSLRGEWQGNVSLGYSLRYSGSLGIFDDSLEENPFLRLSLRSRHGRSPYGSLIRLSESPAFFYLSQRARWLSKFEGQTHLYGLLKTSDRSRVLLAGESAYTRVQNFPQSYYIWGGTPLLGAGYDENYLNRGFPAQGFVARRLVRVSGEWIWGIWTPRASLSWNRVRVQSVDLRLVGESVTWDSFFNPKYRLGKSFSSSAGAEVDILGSGLHYISYKLSVGAFRGIGDFSDMHYTAQFRMGLDL